MIPFVSILVPVYNAEKYIGRFLETALNQSLNEIEIICVDNHSTDTSESIIHSYMQMYPEKIIFLKTERHYETCAHARNIALLNARGTYVFMCDSDDMLPPYAMEVMYNAAEKNDVEIVCGGARIVHGDGLDLWYENVGAKQNQKVNNETAIILGCEWWERLIRKDLLGKVGLIPEDFIFDDVAYIPVLQSYAKNILFLDKVVYYHFRRNDSLSGILNYQVCYSSVLAEKYALENCNPLYLKAVQRFVAQRTKYNMSVRWPFYDIYIDWAREQMQWLPNNELVRKKSSLYESIKCGASLTNNLLPNRIYVNGFVKQLDNKRKETLTDKVFWEGAEIVSLSLENCDVNLSEYTRAIYEKGDYELLAGYFALKNIYEKGGVFIHDRIQILNYFSFYKYQNAFFVLLDQNNYSDSIFGSPANNEVILNILQTFSYEWDKKEKYMSLAERIKIILSIQYNIPLDGKEKLFQFPVSVLSAELAVANGDSNFEKKPVICEHDFSDYAEQEDYITLRRSSLTTIIEHVEQKGEKIVFKTSNEKRLEQELNEIKESNLWKLMLKLKKIGDGPKGPFLKKIFHGLLKLKKK